MSIDKKRYRKKATAPVSAIQLNLETEGFSYRKWGGEQRCKAGDWLVENRGECYTIDQQSFADTYTKVSLGVYRKSGVVWAGVATEPGVVDTREGGTEYRAGDYLVCNNTDGTDVYAVQKAIFEASYDEVTE